MSTRKERAFLRRPFVLSLILGALAFIPSAPLNPPVVEAQGRPDLEGQHQRLLPLFELAGVVFTDPTRGRTAGRGRPRSRCRRIGSWPASRAERRQPGRGRRRNGGDLCAGLVARRSPTSRAACRSTSRRAALQHRLHCLQEWRGRLRHRLALQRQTRCGGRHHVLPAVVPGVERLHRDRDRGSAICSEQRRVPEGKKVSPVGCELQQPRRGRARFRAVRSLERTHPDRDH